MRPIVLIGGGGHCKAVMEVAKSQGLEILGVLDHPEDKGKSVLSATVIGEDADIPSFARKADFVVTVGFIKNPATRIRLYESIKKAKGTLATIVASTAHVSQYASLGEGTVVMHHALVNADARVGVNAIINNFANIEHDTEIGDHTHISTGAIVNGGCRIGRRCFIGSQAVIANGINVCDDTIIGAGSVVVKDIIQPGTYAGNPAKRIK